MAANENDQHATIAVPISTDKTTIHLRYRQLWHSLSYSVPADGAPSSDLRIVSEQWNAAQDQLLLQVAGVNGKVYDLPLYNAPSGISVQGATITKPASGLALEVAFPEGPPGAYTTRSVVLKFPTK